FPRSRARPARPRGTAAPHLPVAEKGERPAHRAPPHRSRAGEGPSVRGRGAPPAHAPGPGIASTARHRPRRLPPPAGLLVLRSLLAQELLDLRDQVARGREHVPRLCTLLPFLFRPPARRLRLRLRVLR